MTPNPSAVLSAIIQYKLAHDGNSPTIRDLVGIFPSASIGTMSRALDQLQADGQIHRDAGNSRSISVPGGKWTYQRGKA